MAPPSGAEAMLNAVHEYQPSLSNGVKSQSSNGLMAALRSQCLPAHAKFESAEKLTGWPA